MYLVNSCVNKKKNTFYLILNQLLINLDKLTFAKSVISPYTKLFDLNKWHFIIKYLLIDWMIDWLSIA